MEGTSCLQKKLPRQTVKEGGGGGPREMGITSVDHVIKKKKI